MNGGLTANDGASAAAGDEPTRFIEVRDRSGYRKRMNDLLPLNPETTAIVSVDMQRDYLDLEVASCPLTPTEAERVMSGCTRLLDFGRAIDVPIIHTYVAKEKIEFEAGVFGNPLSRLSTREGLTQNVWRGVREIPDRIVGSPQAEIPERLLGSRDIHISSKRTNDSCYGTNLTLLLERVFKTETVLLIGVNTDSCVHSTAFSLFNRGYNTVIVEDCVGSTRGLDHHVMALELMSRTFAWVMDIPVICGKLSNSATNA